MTNILWGMSGPIVLCVFGTIVILWLDKGRAGRAPQGEKDARGDGAPPEGQTPTTPAR